MCPELELHVLLAAGRGAPAALCLESGGGGGGGGGGAGGVRPFRPTTALSQGLGRESGARKDTGDTSGHGDHTGQRSP